MPDAEKDTGLISAAKIEERERIASAIEAGPWGRGMPNAMHQEAINACVRIARTEPLPEDLKK